jgi:phytoene/squalene synthetase
MDDDLNACAALVERGDPVRFRAAMASPMAARRVLFPLYAFNLEVARAPWVTQEPMIARMRLQWWRDALAEIAAGGVVRRHEVVTPLALVIRAEDAMALDRLVQARERDADREDCATEAELLDYIDATSAPLIAVAARRLGGGEALAAAAGRALGLANWLMAVPVLEAAGRRPLPEPGTAAVVRMAKAGQAALAEVRAGWRPVPVAARPAFHPLAGTGAVLAKAVREPGRVAEDRLDLGPFGARVRMALTAATGRVW